MMKPYVPKNERERIAIMNAQLEFLHKNPEASPTEIAAFTQKALYGEKEEVEEAEWMEEPNPGRLTAGDGYEG